MDDTNRFDFAIAALLCVAAAVVVVAVWRDLSAPAAVPCGCGGDPVEDLEAL